MDPDEEGEEPIKLEKVLREAEDVPETYRTLFLGILEHIEDLQDFLNSESLGIISNERN